MSLFSLTRLAAELDKIATEIEKCGDDYDFDTADHWDDPYVKDQRNRFADARNQAFKSKETLLEVIRNFK